MPPKTFRYMSDAAKPRNGDTRGHNMKSNPTVSEKTITSTLTAAATAVTNTTTTASNHNHNHNHNTNNNTTTSSHHDITTAQYSNGSNHISIRTPLISVGGRNGNGWDTPPLRYRTDLDKHVIHFAFQRFPHSIEIVEDEDVIAGDWNFFWMNVGRIRSIFATSEYRLTDSQIINHFPNHYELTRKDLMYKNIKKYIRDPANAHICIPHTPPPSSVQFPLIETNNTTTITRGMSSSALPCNPFSLRFSECVPVTYNIPNDLQMFVEEFRRQPGSTWIVKPTARSQGRGIFLINRISQLKRWLKEKKEIDELEGNPVSGFIVSKYVVDPLLIGGKKFDLRLYVLVTSFKPLVAYLHEEGFARFCATRYVASALDDDNLHAHLTNVALQKGDEAYNNSHGGKWSLANLCLFLRGRYGAACADGLLRSIEFVIQHSLRAVAPVMFNDKHCFELYGYDILIDSSLRPHLIEVNASPSLSTTTVSDRLLKESVLEDVLRVIFPPGFPSPQAMSYWEYRVRTDMTTALPTGFRLLQE
ncbi:tubulin tyrosine ligase [Trypanosoma theileri]|uniref:Tubulin tyrosine ligase n=1 Tax=Trypanosoma theileri TaxID=67003 RepID=A0A1X0NFU6_9TRYP|nr:tubulin tyrosine ligase [Trypanosoma theileri]ORC83602.1 tubulin tyrosine ligase [Trypanosoma theileri]